MELIIAIMMYLGMFLAPGLNGNVNQNGDDATIQTVDHNTGGIDGGGNIIVPDPDEL
jgi:hypothetical protein